MNVCKTLWGCFTFISSLTVYSTLVMFMIPWLCHRDCVISREMLTAARLLLYWVRESDTAQTQGPAVSVPGSHNNPLPVLPSQPWDSTDTETHQVPWYLVSKGAPVLYVILACMPCIYTYQLLMWVSLCELSSPGCSLDVWPSPDMSVSTQVYCDAPSLRPSLISPHINHKSQVRGAILGTCCQKTLCQYQQQSGHWLSSSENFSCCHDEKSSPVKPCQGQLAGTMGREREPDYRAQSVYLLRFLVTPRGGEGAHLYRPR